jgi:hypothetical protein
MAKRKYGEGKLHEMKETKAEEILEHATGMEAPDEKTLAGNIVDKILYRGKYKK